MHEAVCAETLMKELKDFGALFRIIYRKRFLQTRLQNTRSVTGTVTTDLLQ